MRLGDFLAAAGRQTTLTLPEPAPEPLSYVVIITNDGGLRGLTHTTPMTEREAGREADEWRRRHYQADVHILMPP